MYWRSLTLSDTSTGGTWSITDTTIATISSTGVVTGISTGSVFARYSIFNSCGGVTIGTPITVNPLPVAGTISGAATLCAGSAVSLSETVSGGVWSVSATGASSVNTAGVVTGIVAGADTIYYTVNTSCGTAVASFPFTVNPLPVAGAISGASSACVGTSVSLSGSVMGGSWSCNLPGIATITSSGVVTALAAGAAIISYTVTNSCGTAYDTAIFTVNPLPVAGAISGPGVVCEGSNISLTTTATGGTGAWSSGVVSIATVSGSGTVYGVLAGTVSISYTVTGICGVNSSSTAITVNPLPIAGSISGLSTVCAGNLISLTDAASGGVWSSTNTLVATIGSTGVVTGVNIGTTTISYTVTNSCGTIAATMPLIVITIPSPGTITGGTVVCEGANITLSTTATGGTWISTATGIATIGSSGMITGVAAGSTIISYTVSNACGSAADTAMVTVNPLPMAGSISGPSAVCIGGTISFLATGTGGVWSSSNTSIATVNSTGVVFAMAVGAINISYTVTNSCGVAAVGMPVTVNSLPAAGTITGPITVCVGASISLADAVPGGVWSSSVPGVASISPSGLVTGIATGNAIISYTVATSCGVAAATKLITVITTLPVGPITGSVSVCQGSTITLADTSAGGLWSSTSAGIAIVNSSGVVSGIAGGSATISYTLSNVCGSSASTILVTITPLPVGGILSGSGSVCTGSLITLTPSVSGGVWCSSVPSVGSVNSSGVVSNLTAGTTIITYTVTNSCGTATATRTITVNAPPTVSPITGGSTVCVGSLLTLSDAIPGGVWSSYAPLVATVNASGVVTAITTGSTIIFYVLSNSCGSTSASMIVTVTALPAPGTISGNSTVCTGTMATLTNSVTGGSWSVSPSTTAVISSGGIVAGITSGSAIVSYTVSNVCGSISDTMMLTVAEPPVADTLGSSSALCLGASLTIPVTTSGTWFSANGFTTITSTGVVTGIAPGMDTIIYVVSNMCGSDTSSTEMHIYTSVECDSVLAVGGSLPFSGELTIYPNPNNGRFVLSLPSINSPAKIIVSDVYGRVVSRKYVAPGFNKDVLFEPCDLAPGIYLVRTFVGKSIYENKITIW
ncbi:hypothetical protein CJD36_001935 [Flavipsychrobacter stenotrophus]|uniref:Secretion system C-terminal sorting domain-containing protein n=1 Tax=Flavipsychrobacter stenotrophus TaxID=2077091 RepID=A0A2S7T001_9BACT|nr:T9SS type A sorting domain-containing protein [Flavipsychrobacter stenotrophus]PQJ12533.1 hypothetical protein CJD36_001935 [Flavipsychrobacter stenotrophus]